MRGHRRQKFSGASTPSSTARSRGTGRILRRENIIALGNCGADKTHVALALGLAACQKGFTVAFTTATAPVSQLMEAPATSGACSSSSATWRRPGC